MKTKITLISLLLITISFLLYPYVASALTVSDSISAGTTWLLDKRFGMNIWAFTTPPDPEQTEFTVDDYTRTYLRDTFAATLTLQALQIDSTVYAGTIDWTEYALPQSTEFIAQQILILSKAGRDYSAPLAALLANRKPDGGFAASPRYPSNNRDSAFALLALKTANYADQTIIQSLINYLLAAQNLDGGVGFYPGGDSNVYMTALFSISLQQLPQTTFIATAINKATAYLLAHQNPDGGFGVDAVSGAPASTVHETALAYIALVGVITDNTVLGNIICYRRSKMDPPTAGIWTHLAIFD